MRDPRRCAASPSRSSSPARNTGSRTAYGSVRARAADIDIDPQQLRVRLLRRELERRGPSRKFRGRPEPLAKRQVVDLDDDAVGVELEILAAVRPRPAEFDTSSIPAHAVKVRLDRQSPCAQRTAACRDGYLARAIRDPPPHSVRRADTQTPPAFASPPATDRGCASSPRRHCAGWRTAARLPLRARC